jgi:nicotinate-nucleotide pyrophosphorylase (carboxylating)
VGLASERRRFGGSGAAGGGRASAAAVAGPPPEAVERFVRSALAEDVGAGDLTTDAVVPASARASAVLVFEEPGVVCGLGLVARVFAQLDPSSRVEALLPEGGACADVPREIARLEGAARALLTGERTALNLLGRLSGVATLTAAYVARVAGTGTVILDTRKTTPGLRALERYAVRCGGGSNHRGGLDAAVLLKENHLRIAGGVAAALAAVSASGLTGVEVEVEAETLIEVEEALASGAPRILLDNMSPVQVAEAVALVDGRALLEASGGMTLESVRAYAEAGVDFISVGALTRSAPALQVSLEVA